MHPFERQVALPLMYKAVPIGEGFKADIVVARAVIPEIRPVAAILPVHEAQVHTYLRMSGLRVGLILNFNPRRLTDGLRRFVLWPWACKPLRLLWWPLRGYFACHAMPTNNRALQAFRRHVINLWRRALRRRSQRDRTTWVDMDRLAARFLPIPRIIHPWPAQRFRVKHPRWKPHTGMPHVRFCAGGAR